MDSNLLNVSKIETFFDGILRNKLSKNIFYTSFPQTIKESWKEIVLVDAGIAMRDLNAYGDGYVNVFIYAKPFANGEKNVPLLDKLETKLSQIIDESNDPHYKISKDTTYSDYDERRNLNCSIFSIKLIIV